MSETQLPKGEGTQNTNPEVARLAKQLQDSKDRNIVPKDKIADVEKRYDNDKQAALGESKAQSNALLQEIEKYIDKHTKRELKDIFLKSGVDGLKELASAHGKMSLNDRKQIMQKFGYSIDHSHVIAAVKIVGALENKQIDINKYFDINQTPQVQSEPDRGVDKVEIKKGKIEIGEAGIYEGEYIMKDGKSIPHGEGILTNKNGNILKGKFENGQIVKGEFIDKATGNKFVGEFKDGVAFNGKMFDSKGTQIGEIKDGKKIIDEKQEKKPELTESERKILERNKKYLEANKTRVDKIIKELDNEKNKGNKDVITKTLKEPTEANVKELQKLIGITGKGVDGKIGPKTMAALEKFVGIKNVATAGNTEGQEKSGKSNNETTNKKGGLDTSKSSRELDREKIENTPKDKEEQLLKSKQEIANNEATKLNNEGLALFEKGDYKAAIEKFNGAIAANPNNPDGYRNKGLTYEKMGVFKGGYFPDAVRMFEIAQKLDTPNKQQYYTDRITSLNIMKTTSGVEYNQYKK